MSGSEAHSSALDSDRNDRDRDDENERASQGLFGDDQILVLPSTVGIYEAPEESCRASSHTSNTELELGDRTLRGLSFDDRCR